MSNCFSEAEQLVLPLDYPSEFSNLETAPEQGSNTSLRKDEQPYICKKSKLDCYHYNQLKLINLEE